MTVFTIILKILTFPGAYLKGFFEQVLAKMCGCLVESNGYLRMDEACGHIDHTLPVKKSKAAVLALLPGTFTFLFGLVFGLTGLDALTVLKIRYTDSVPLFVVYILFTYVGFSMLCNVFPLVEDALNSKERLYDKSTGANLFVQILLFIPTHLNVAGAYLEKYGITFFLLAAVNACSFLLL